MRRERHGRTQLFNVLAVRILQWSSQAFVLPLPAPPLPLLFRRALAENLQVSYLASGDLRLVDLVDVVFPASFSPMAVVCKKSIVLHWRQTTILRHDLSPCLNKTRSCISDLGYRWLKIMWTLCGLNSPVKCGRLMPQPILDWNLSKVGPSNQCGRAGAILRLSARPSSSEEACDV